MKLIKILLFTFLFMQILFLDFDNLFHWSMNKKTYLNILGIVLIISIFYAQQKKHAPKIG